VRATRLDVPHRYHPECDNHRTSGKCYTNTVISVRRKCETNCNVDVRRRLQVPGPDRKDTDGDGVLETRQGIVGRAKHFAHGGRHADRIESTEALWNVSQRHELCNNPRSNPVRQPNQGVLEHTTRHTTRLQGVAGAECSEAGFANLHGACKAHIQGRMCQFHDNDSTSKQ